jgi:hypothetical protein
MAEVASIETIERSAIAYSDGSFNIFSDGYPIGGVFSQLEQDNRSERMENRAVAVKVRLLILEFLKMPPAPTMIKCNCGRQFRTQGGIQECLANNHFTLPEF